MFIIGLLLTAFSTPIAIGFIKACYLLSEHPYQYRLANGMSEGNLAALTILFTVAALAGLVLMLFGWAKRRNKATMDSITNTDNQNYCSTCNINVANTCTKCPICGKPLTIKERKHG